MSYRPLLQRTRLSRMRYDAYLEPHLGSAALLTIDVQHDTLDGRPAEIPGTSAVLPAILELVEMFRVADRPIMHLVRLYQPDGSNVDLCRRAAVERGAEIFLSGTAGAELAPGLAPEGTSLDTAGLLEGRIQQLRFDEVVIYKPRWGAFYRTPLEAELDLRGVDTLVFAGANYPNCPRASIYEASERDFRIVVARDAISRLTHAGELELEAIGVRVWDVEQIEDQLLLGRSAPAM